MEQVGSPEAQQFGISFSRASSFVPFGDSYFNTQQAYSTTNPMMLESSVTLRSMGIQGAQNPTNNALSDINLVGGNSNYDQDPALPRPKRRMVSQENILPNSTNWSSFVQSDAKYNSSTGPLAQRYTLYDKRYEAIGLPVDPHLRIFNATNGDGNSGSI